MKSDYFSTLENEKKNGRGVGAFNITSFDQMLFIIRTAAQRGNPVIIQTSEKVAKYYTPELIIEVFTLFKEYHKANIFINLDHCRDENFAVRCAEAGYTGVMVDFSALDYKENAYKTKMVVEKCRKLNVSVEGEIGVIPGVEDGIKTGSRPGICDPETALRFIEDTGVDLLAPSVGTAHGIYRESPEIHFELIKRIKEMIEEKKFDTLIVIHGCSGLSDEVVRKIIDCGGTKFNVSTDIKMAVVDSLKRDICEYSNINTLGIVDNLYKSIKRKVNWWLDTLGYK